MRATGRLPGLLGLAWLAVLLVPSGQLDAAGPRQLQPSGVESKTQTPTPPQALVGKYCVTCHNQKLKTAGLMLDTVDFTNISAGAETWEKVVKKLRAGAMPPAGLARPDKATYDSVISYLETEIDRAAAAKPNPGRTETFHRLNRAEYQNAIRDLLALEIDAASLLPGDDTDLHGFDNTADVLSLSPALLDRYLAAARKLSRLAIGRAPGSPVVLQYSVPRMLYQDDRVSEDLPFGSRGGLAVQHQFPVDGEYVFKIRLQRQYVDYIRGLGTRHQIDLRLDGTRIKRFAIGGEAPGNMAPASYAANILGTPDWEEYMLHADDNLQVRVPVKAGPRMIGVAFARKLSEPEGIKQPRQVGFALAINEWYDGNAAIESVEIAGPYAVSGPGDTPSRKKILVCRPRPAQEQGCAEKIITTLARRAYRRPVTKSDLRTLMQFYKDGRGDGGFEAGLEFAIERILSDPDFIFRVERDPANVAPGTPYRLSDIDLASRLSFFVWSSIPDDELLDLAVSGKLKTPTVLEAQVRRMLADPRSKALVDNFAGQWLYLRTLQDITPNTDIFPDFDDNLRVAFRHETELFIDSQLREDRSVAGLLSADYTFVNERLARHYGIPGVYGERFRRVTLSESTHRGGLLGHGSILAVTSYPTRTSPVLRGKWLLENVLGTPPPPPPPNVPALRDRGENGRPASVRERLEQHRRNPVCATCHAPMDPLGFALENFDAIGAWRTSGEARTSIDSSGMLPGGVKFEGLPGLRTVLMERREQFVGTVTEKLLAYSVGRAAHYFDRPVIRKIVRDAAPDYRWSSIILGIVKSPVFQMRRSSVPEEATPVTGVNASR